MKSRAKKKPKSKFASDVGKALRRSSKRARETARRFGTLIHIEVDNKIIGLKP